MWKIKNESNSDTILMQSEDFNVLLGKSGYIIWGKKNNFLRCVKKNWSDKDFHKMTNNQIIDLVMSTL
ncbi:MAG: hypothetical protein QW156_03925 [Candidatus Aenigmatarchaeota archaeon]